MLTFPPDITFVVQIASFVILWFGLKRLLFDPVLQLLEEREARTVGARHEAETMQAAVQESAAEYERRLREVRFALAAEFEAARAATRDEERQVLAAAREHSGAQLAQLRENLARQAAAARPALLTEAQDLAARMLERVIGRNVA